MSVIMCQLPIDIHDIIFEFLDKATYNRLRRVCKSYDIMIPKINDMYNLPVELLRNITKHTLLYNPQIKMLDISESKDDMTEISIPNVMILKSKMIPINRGGINAFCISKEHHIHGISTLRVIINVKLSYALYRENCVSICRTPNILIAIYNNSMYDKKIYLYKGETIYLYNAKPYVLICDLDDRMCFCAADVINVQIYQIVENGQPVTYKDINPYVLIIRLPEDSYFHDHTPPLMPNLKCCMLFSYDPHYYQLSISTIISLLEFAPNLEELYMVCVKPSYCGNGFLERDGFTDIEGRLTVNGIWSLLSRSEGSKLKYMQVSISGTNRKYIRKVDEAYIPCCISKVDDYRYTLTLDDIYQLYKHFKIPMTSELYKLFVDIGIAV